MYTAKWSDFDEVEVLPNNFRIAVAGERIGLNQIRWEHPAGFPKHAHPDNEQAILVTEGEIELNIGGEAFRARVGDIVIIPAGVPHSGQSTGQPARFLEVFAPYRVQYLKGFIGGL